MATKLKVKDQTIDLIRGASIPREGDVIYITLKGEKEETLYTVDLVEHEYNFNVTGTVGTTTITLKEVKSKKKKSEE